MLIVHLWFNPNYFREISLHYEDQVAKFNCVKDRFNNIFFSDILFYMPHVLQCVDTLKQTVLGLSSIEVPVAKIFQEAALNHFRLCCFRDRRGEKTWGKGEL